MRRPCLVCGQVSNGSRCPTHANTTARGYGAAFQRAQRDRAHVEATRCATCGKAFTRANPKTAGHRVALRDGGTLADGIKPECRRCNYGWKRSGS